MSSHEVHPLDGSGPEQRMLFNTEADNKFVNPIRLDSDAGFLALYALADDRLLFTHILSFYFIKLLVFLLGHRPLGDA